MNSLVHDRKKVCRGRLLILGAAVLWSLGGCFAKSIGLPGTVMACFRVLFAALFLLPLVPRRRVPFRWAFVGMTLCFSVMNLSFVLANVLTTSANAIFLQYTAPIWMVLGSVLWLKEPFDKKSFRSLAVSLIGIPLIVVGSRTESLGVSLALLAGVAYGGVALFLRVLRDESPILVTFLNHAVGGLTLIPLVWYFYPDAVGSLSGANFLALAMFGIVQMGVPYILFARGLKTVSAQEAGLIAFVEPVLNPALTYLVNGEVPAGSTVLGGAFIIVGVLLRYRGIFRRSRVRAPG